MKALRTLSMHSIAQEERQSAMEVCTGMAERVALTRAVLPATLSMLPFQCGMRAATTSMIACSSPRFSLKMESGIPRYRLGKPSIRQERTSCTRWITTSFSCICLNERIKGKYSVEMAWEVNTQNNMCNFNAESAFCLPFSKRKGSTKKLMSRPK